MKKVGSVPLTRRDGISRRDELSRRGEITSGRDILVQDEFDYTEKSYKVLMSMLDAKLGWA